MQILEEECSLFIGRHRGVFMDDAVFVAEDRSALFKRDLCAYTLGGEEFEQD